MMLTVMERLTEAERAMLAALRRKAGQTGGRPPKMSPVQIEAAQRMRDDGVKVGEVAKRLEVDRATVYRHTTGPRS